jgi:DNA polymerase-4
LDTFYVSVERRDFPGKYDRKPVVVVLRVNRAPVASASYEAREYDVHAGMPLAEAKRKYPHLTVIPGRMFAYEEAHEEFVSICYRYSPNVLPYGLDEAWLEVSDKDVHEAAYMLKEDVKNELRLPITVGIGENRLHAKMGSEYGKPDGFVRVYEWEMFFPLDVSKLFMVGPKREEKLKSLGIRTIGGLATAPREYLIQHFKPFTGNLLYNYSHGIDDPPVPFLGFTGERKSTGHNHTLKRDTSDVPLLEAELFGISARLVKALQASESYAGGVALNITWEDLTHTTRSRKLPNPTNHVSKIFSYGRRRLRREMELNKKKVRAVGLSVYDFYDSSLEPYEQLEFAID